eukprot:SAG31_NODE_2853_length_4992_cov_5.719599_6_plen_165_part_00
MCTKSHCGSRGRSTGRLSQCVASRVSHCLELTVQSLLGLRPPWLLQSARGVQPVSACCPNQSAGRGGDRPVYAERGSLGCRAARAPAAVRCWSRSAWGGGPSAGSDPSAGSEYTRWRFSQQPWMHAPMTLQQTRRGAPILAKKKRHSAIRHNMRSCVVPATSDQ